MAYNPDYISPSDPRFPLERPNECQPRTPESLYQDAPKKPNIIREINVKQLSFGYIVESNNNAFCIFSKEELVKDFIDYIINPDTHLWSNKEI